MARNGTRYGDSTLSAIASVGVGVALGQRLVLEGVDDHVRQQAEQDHGDGDAHAQPRLLRPRS